jgi:hypothetical protein
MALRWLQSAGGMDGSAVSARCSPEAWVNSRRARRGGWTMSISKHEVSWVRAPWGTPDGTTTAIPGP